MAESDPPPPPPPTSSFQVNGARGQPRSYRVLRPSNGDSIDAGERPVKGAIWEGQPGFCQDPGHYCQLTTV